MPDIYGRTGGPFLDQIEKEARELKSARVENRDPDFSLDNLNPIEQAVFKEEAEMLDKLKNSKFGKRLHTLEVDLFDSNAVQRVIDMLVGHKENLDKEGETTPTSLVPGVVDPTVDNSVTPANVNVPEPTVPTQDTVMPNKEENEEDDTTRDSDLSSYNNSDSVSSGGPVTDSTPTIDQANSADESTTPVARNERQVAQPPEVTSSEVSNIDSEFDLNLDGDNDPSTR